MLNSSRGVTSLAWLLGLALLFTLPHPASTQKANSWEIVGTTGVAAQQIFAVRWRRTSVFTLLTLTRTTFVVIADCRQGKN